MVSPNQLAEIGLLLGEPARAAMLMALMDGRALTAAELALAAGITPQTASTHLARLASANMLAVQKQGRHRYHRLASPRIAELLENVMQIGSTEAVSPRPIRTGPKDAAMREARICYDHFAGRLGVTLADALTTQGLVELDDSAGRITAEGVRFFERHEIALAPASPRSKRPLCRPCLDWSERRLHIAGHLGKGICEHFFARNWVRRTAGSRALQVSPDGWTALRDLFGIRRDWT